MNRLRNPENKSESISYCTENVKKWEIGFFANI